MVRPEILFNCVVTASVHFTPSFRSRSTSVRSAAANCSPHGCSKISHLSFGAVVVAAPFRVPLTPPARTRRRRVVQDPNEVLAMETSTFLGFVQEAAPFTLVRLAILLTNRFQILLARVHIHPYWVAHRTPLLGYIFF
jgi:hypothetical protein